MLCQVVQHFTELGLNVRRARISSDGGWFVDGARSTLRVATVGFRFKLSIQTEDVVQSLKSQTLMAVKSHIHASSPVLSRSVMHRLLKSKPLNCHTSLCLVLLVCVCCRCSTSTCKARKCQHAMQVSHCQHALLCEPRQTRHVL